VRNQTQSNFREDISLPKDVPIYHSARRGLIALEELREVLRYRNLIYQLVRRDIVSRYKRSVLGISWTMLNPLGMMIILTFVFSNIFHMVKGYPAYVLSGLLAWTFFSQTTHAAIFNLVWGGEYFQRIYLPRSVFALSSIGTGLVNLLLSMIPLLIVMLIVGVPIRLTILFSPVAIILLAFFSLGVGLLISCLAIYFPDVIDMYQIVLMGWFYLTPILYPFEIIPERFRTLIHFNPMLSFVNLFRVPIYDGQLPTAADLIIAFVAALVTVGIGWWVFARKSDEFAYRT